jgi:hypothetical protein
MFILVEGGSDIVYIRYRVLCDVVVGSVPIVTVRSLGSNVAHAANVTHSCRLRGYGS